jgi:hypothetical protein
MTGAAPKLHREHAASLNHWRRCAAAARGPGSALTSIPQKGGPRGQIPAAPITDAAQTLPATASGGDEAGKEGVAVLGS